MLVFLGVAWLRLKRASRHWLRQVVDGHQVWVTPNLGPAVMGCIAPRMLLPRWILDIAPASRRLILTHELQHIAARDACLLSAALLVVAVSPWNVFLWWQLRRLRLAIELDCDVRVLKENTDVRSYAETLLLAARKPLMFKAALTLTEASSHLEHRIAAMVEPRAKPRWTVLAASVGLSFGFIAAAVALNAPHITSATTDLRKLPPAEYNSSFLQAAEAAARASYPELFRGNFSGQVEIQVGLDRNGSVLGVDQRSGPFLSARFFRSFPTGARRFANPVGWAATHGYEVQDTVVGPTKLLAWHGPENRDKLYLSFDVIKWPHDPLRSAELVRDAVVAHYPGTLLAHEPVDGTLPLAPFATGSAAPVGYQTGAHLMPGPKLAAMEPLTEERRARAVQLITVFMNDDGTINRSDLRTLTVDKDEPPQSTAVFAQMHVDTSQLAHRGVIWQVRAAYAGGPEVVVDYAWPRRSDDPSDEADRSIIEQVYGPPASEASVARDEALDRAILTRYFPDLSQQTSEAQVKLPWVLLDRTGNIQATGTAERAALLPGLLGLPRDLERMYPGIRTGECVRAQIKSPRGQSTWLTYIWLAPDSSVVRLEPH
jgi:hypothetical protein